MMNAMITKMIKKNDKNYFKDFQCVAGSVLHKSKWDPNRKQNAAHEPTCIHVEHFCETSNLNSLHFLPVTVQDEHFVRDDTL